MISISAILTQHALGEYICEVITWEDSHGVCALQFITSTGRISQNYGGNGGKPTIMRSTGGLLTAFAGQVKGGIVHRIQVLYPHIRGIMLR